MLSIRKKLVLIVFILCMLLITVRFCVLLPDHFSQKMLTQNIKEEFIPPSQECLNSDELRQIVANPIHYLGKGSQAIAFVSADNNYVIKFFLNERFHTKLRIRSPFRKTASPRVRFDVLKRYAKAFQEIKEETGLIAIHLSANTTDLPNCILEDPKGLHHLIDLNQFSFMVQKRCDCINTTFSKMSLEEKEKTLIALETLMYSLAQKGFYNLRGDFKDENFAILNGQAFMIDVGNVIFLKDQKEHPEQEFQKVKNMLQTWMKEKKL